MLNRSIIAILAIVIVAIIGVAAYSGSNQLKPTNQADLKNITITNNDIQQNNTTEDNITQTMITPTEAQEIAQKYIEEPGATTGTPHIIDVNGQKIYVVPVIMNNATVGQIEIDAFTGNNVGGAGGVSP